MLPAAERRSARRFPIEVGVELEVEGRVVHARHTRDLCLRGTFARTGEVVAPGRTRRVLLFPRSGASEGDAIDVLGRVARIERTGLAVEFTEISMASYLALRRLLESVLGDSAGLDR